MSRVRGVLAEAQKVYGMSVVSSVTFECTLGPHQLTRCRQTPAGSHSTGHGRGEGRGREGEAPCLVMQRAAAPRREK